jgi:hypothetical protein
MRNKSQDYKSSGAGSMIIIYKKKNNLKGFKIVKMKIAKELQNELIKEIVIMTGGDISKISHILDD